MPSLRKIAQANKQAVEDQGYKELDRFSKENRVINNLIHSVNLKFNTSFTTVDRPFWTREDCRTADLPYPVFFEDCDVRGVPSIIDASLQYRDELIGLWFMPNWMSEIASQVSPSLYMRNLPEAQWDDAVNAFHAGLQGDLETVGAYIGGMELMREAHRELVSSPRFITFGDDTNTGVFSGTATFKVTTGKP